METMWEIRKQVITPEEVVARINKCIDDWAAEEKAAAEQKNKEGYAGREDVRR